MELAKTATTIQMRLGAKHAAKMIKARSFASSVERDTDLKMENASAADKTMRAQSAMLRSVRDATMDTGSIQMEDAKSALTLFLCVANAVREINAICVRLTLLMWIRMENVLFAIPQMVGHQMEILVGARVINTSTLITTIAALATITSMAVSGARSLILEIL
jgi:hypothetical protein